MQSATSTPGHLAAPWAALAHHRATSTAQDNGAGLRALLEAQIEHLIAALDLMDGDPDLEPSLAGFNGQTALDMVDREANDADAEPSLGSLGGTAAGCERAHQTRWAGGCRSDLEGPGNEDDEDGGDEELTGDENEPSLAAPARIIDQERWTGGDNSVDIVDGEIDPTEPPALLREGFSGDEWLAGRTRRREVTEQAHRLRRRLRGAPRLLDAVCLSDLREVRL